MIDLFEKIPKGSILLWNVQDESELPKRKELIRMLKTEDFIYYKSHGHHRRYVQILARLKFCLSSERDLDSRSYWHGVPCSDFLFTAKEIESHQFFTLKYFTQCLGSYFVGAAELDSLDRLLRNFDNVRRITQQIKNWPETVQEHQAEIAKGVIQDRVIENFDMAQLLAITDGYGVQAIDHALFELQAWNDAHFWKEKKPKQAAVANEQALFI